MAWEAVRVTENSKLSEKPNPGVSAFKRPEAISVTLVLQAYSLLLRHGKATKPKVLLISNFKLASLWWTNTSQTLVNTCDSLLFQMACRVVHNRLSVAAKGRTVNAVGFK
jgi:hypothetical protein